MKRNMNEFLEWNMEIDRMINEGLAGGMIDSRYPLWRLDINGVQECLPLNKAGCEG